MPDTESQRPLANHTLGVRAARTLSNPTLTAPQMLSVSPRWLLQLLPWINVEGGVYQVNRRRIVLKQSDRIPTRLEGDAPRVDPKALRAIALLRNADEELLEAIEGLLVSERHPANAEIYSEGDPGEKLYVIVKGKVDITTTDAHGERLRLALYGEGDYFGETALLSEWRHTTTARSLTPSIFLTLERVRFEALLQSSPALRSRFEVLLRDRESSGVKHNQYGEAGIEIASYHDNEPELQRTFVDYDDEPRQYPLSVMQTVIRLHTRVTDLYDNVYDQLREQLRLTFEGMKERQESEIINDPEFGLLHAAAPSMRIRTRSGPPTPDDFDDMLAHVWKEPGYFLAHPRAIAAFGRECTRRGVPPPTVNMFGSPFLTWRGVPIVPCDKLAVHRNSVARLPHPSNRGLEQPAGLTNILLIRVGEQKQGVVGLHHTGLPGEQLPGLSVRFMGIDSYSTASYLVTLYYSAAVLTDDAVAVLENVEVGNYHDGE
ncbi:MAG: family 2B encapsulin nanocompartment shell protein [Myxococcota bacterium]